MQLLLLGTGTPDPDPRRCGSGTAILQDSSGPWLLIDCGRGVTQRALEAGLDLARLDTVLLTHHHTDHISDLATLAISRFIAGAPAPLRVVVPDGPCRRFAERCLDAFDDQSFYSQRSVGSSERPEIEVDSFVATADIRTVFEVEPWTGQSVLVEHHPIEAAVGYRVTDGTATVAVSGDTIVCPGVAQLAQDADVLIHQALRTDLVTAEVLRWNASARSVGELAAESEVARLILTHLMPAPANTQEEQAFLDEARSGGYRGSISVAHDLDRITLR